MALRTAVAGRVGPASQAASTMTMPYTIVATETCTSRSVAIVHTSLTAGSAAAGLANEGKNAPPAPRRPGSPGGAAATTPDPNPRIAGGRHWGAGPAASG